MTSAMYPEEWSHLTPAQRRDEVRQLMIATDRFYVPPPDICAYWLMVVEFLRLSNARTLLYVHVPNAAVYASGGAIWAHDPHRDSRVTIGIYGGAKHFSAYRLTVNWFVL